MDHQITSLKPGQSIRLTGDDACWVTVERSGNGKLIRFIRHTPNSFAVFRTCAF